MPDRASLFICGIEDRQYKDEKINCTPILLAASSFSL